MYPRRSRVEECIFRCITTVDHDFCLSVAVLVLVGSGELTGLVEVAISVQVVIIS